MRLMLGKGWFPASRMLFLSGAMSFISGVFMILFLCVSTAVAILQAVGRMEYFPSNPSLFPQWPVWNRDLAIILILSTAIILFLPKLLAIIWMLVKGVQTKSFGGPVRLFMSIVLETLLSVLLAPIRMLFHSRFVVMTLLGLKPAWGAQQREEDQTHWPQALKYHRNDVLLGIIWGMVVFLFNPGFLVWLAPILIALILSIPLSVWTSRKESGRLFRRLGLFLTPEEISPPLEVKLLKEFQQDFQAENRERHPGFIRAITDPCVNTLHLSLLGNKKKKVSTDIGIRRHRLRKKALHTGPKGLASKEKREILSDPTSMSVLHRWVWELPALELSKKWGVSIT